MVKTVAAKTRKAIVRAAQHSAEKIRAVAADAASAATQAAAGVVLASTASALEGAVRKSRNPHPASKRRHPASLTICSARDRERDYSMLQAAPGRIWAT